MHQRAFALSFEFGDSEWQLDWDTNVAYTAQWRVAKQDDKQFRYKDTGDIVADSRAYALLINTNDGDNNFNRSLVQNKVSMVTEMDLMWRDYGLFARGRAYYDDVYDQDTDQSQEDFLTYNNSRNFPNGDADFRRFPQDTVDEHRDRLEMLDYFLYASGELAGERYFNVRLGSQVINWGEATFTSGINGLQNRADLIARNTPGVEVKEILLPTGAIYGQVDLVPDLTLEAYYQYEWKKTELNGVGSYFSDRDFLGPGARNFLIPVGAEPGCHHRHSQNCRRRRLRQRPVGCRPALDRAWGYGHWPVLHQCPQQSPGLPGQLSRGGVRSRSPTPSCTSRTSRVTPPVSPRCWPITNVQGEVSYKTDVPVVLLKR